MSGTHKTEATKRRGYQARQADGGAIGTQQSTEASQPHVTKEQSDPQPQRNEAEGSYQPQARIQ